MPVMPSLGRTLLSCRGAAATPGARAVLAKARPEPWDMTGDVNSGVVIIVTSFPSQIREQALVPEPRPEAANSGALSSRVSNHHHARTPQQVPRVQGLE